MSMPSTGKSGFLVSFFFNFNTRRINTENLSQRKKEGPRITSWCLTMWTQFHTWHCSPQEPLPWQQSELLNPFTLSVPSSTVGENGNGAYLWAHLQNNLRCIILYWELENQYTLVEWNSDFSKRSGALLELFICWATADHLYKRNSPKEQQFKDGSTKDSTV